MRMLNRWTLWRRHALAVVLLGLTACYPDEFTRSNVNDPDSPDYQEPAVDADLDGYTSDVDCDDGDAAINPGASEACNGVDDDCDLSIDDGLEQSTYYLDTDGDGYGAGAGDTRCGGPVGDEVKVGGDCDDDDELVHPGVTEICNGKDDNCDDQIDEGLDAQTYYQDDDGDGYGTGDPTTTCDDPPDGTTDVDGDCDDDDPDINPGADELCNDVDDDCDDDVDEDLTETTYYTDSDGDGYGVTSSASTHCGPAGDSETEASGDCDDDDTNTYPGALELCDTEDNDCDGTADEELNLLTWYPDQDGDGYGEEGSLGVISCDEVPGRAPNDGDCDDADPTINAGAEEVCDGVDNDCDGSDDTTIDLDEDGALDCDQDGDGVFAFEYEKEEADCDDTDPLVYPGATEFYDFKDNDCEGTTDLDLDFETEATTAFVDESGEGMGRALLAAADLDGETGRDLLVQVGVSEPAGVYLWSGSSLLSSGEGPMASFMLGTEDGGTAAAVVDINGDGALDIALSALLTSEAGTVYVFAGGESGFSAKDYASSDAKLAIAGKDYGLEAGSRFGAALLSVDDDLDGDGLNDLLISAPGANDGAGSVYLISRNSVVTRIDGASAGDGLGESLALTSDGRSTSVWISAPGADKGSGNVYVIDSLEALLADDQVSISEIASSTLVGESESGLGTRLAGNSTSSGDAGLLISATVDGAGVVYLVPDTSDPATVDLKSALVYSGGNVADLRTGFAWVGDIDQDGNDDFALTGIQDGESDQAALFLIYGGELEGSLEADTGASFFGPTLSGTSTVSVVGADLDGSGAEDLVLGTHSYSETREGTTGFLGVLLNPDD